MPTVPDLKRACKVKGLKGYSKLRKTELLKLLETINLGPRRSGPRRSVPRRSAPRRSAPSVLLISPDKKNIIDLFTANVKGNVADTSNSSKKHCGKEGHWLEKQMGIRHNSKNEPDMYGYEMKTDCVKTTFGDYSASEYLFSKKQVLLDTLNGWNIKNIVLRSDFIKIFGLPNHDKNGRYSWSGKCVPKYGKWNDCGQTMEINDTNDIIAYYMYSKDKRDDGIKDFFPDYLKVKDKVAYAIWKSDKLSVQINRKFNNKGFFICKKDKQGVYDKIVFGRPFDFIEFIQGIKDNKIIFDSGMYDGNSRNYSQFRASSTGFWNTLLI